MTGHIPKKGDFVALAFDPQAGHEQRGRRPALVISNDLFNRHTGLCICCPITSAVRDFPFHVRIPDGQKVAGDVMVEQVKSVDFRAREMRRIGRAPDSVVSEVLALLDAIVY